MNKESDLRICHRCRVPHHENCPRCFGFGLTKDGFPIFAADALSGKVGTNYIKCPVCHSTPNGISVEDELEDLSNKLKENHDLLRKSINKLK